MEKIFLRTVLKRITILAIFFTSVAAHLGVIKNGVGDTESESVRSWAGAKENYKLTEENGKTLLVVGLESTDDFKDYFTKTFPVAL